MPMLRGLCASYVADATAQQDLVQEAFIYAYEKLGALRNHDRYGAWLAKIGRSRCLDWLRRQRREHEVREQATISEPDSRAEDGLNLVVQRELRDWIHTRIAQLPAKSREAMALCYVEGCSTKEAARFLGVRESALRKRLEYGRKLLGEKLCEELGQTGLGSRDFTALRKRVLLALPAAAVPVKSGAAAGVAGVVGGFLTVKTGLVTIAVVGVAFALLSQWNRETDRSEQPVAQAASDGSIVESTASGDRAVPASAPAQKPNAQGAVVPQKVYDRFFFIRYNTVNGSVESSTLVLATVTPDGFTFTDWYTRSGTLSDIHPLYTGAGRIVATTSEIGGSLIAIDAATGRVDEITTVMMLCERDGKLYEVDEKDGNATFRVYDCAKFAYRDLLRVPWTPWIGEVQVSPDNRRLAYFGPKQSVSDTGETIWIGIPMLNVVDLQTNTTSIVGEPLQHVDPPFSSVSTDAKPPFQWLDSTTILVVQSKSERTGRFGTIRRTLSSVNVETGETKDLIDLPGNEFNSAWLDYDEWEDRLVLDLHNLGQFTVDVRNRTLSEYDSIGGVFRMTEDRYSATLYHGPKVLSTTAGKRDYAVSPDKRQIVWIERDINASAQDDSSHQPMMLRYYDADQGEVRTVAEGSFQLPSPGRRCWLSDEDLAREREPAPMEEGWIPFSPQPWPSHPTERPPKPDTRRDVNDYLTLAIDTEADRYWLHEPIEVTVTLTNISAGDLTVLRPVFYDGRVMETRLIGGRTHQSLEQIQSYIPEPEEIVLGPGESVSVTGPIEVAREGAYSIETVYRGVQDRPDNGWKRSGHIQTESRQFEIVRSTDEAVLFEEKVDRLLAKAAAEFESAPDWNGMNYTLESLKAMGSGASPQLFNYVQSAGDPRFRTLLLRTLKDLAYPDALPYFAELLKGGTSVEQEAAVGGLYELYLRHNGCVRDDIAQSALIYLATAIATPDSKVRTRLVSVLCRVKNDRVRNTLERVVDDPEESIRDTAARYLAAYGGVSLADWLSQATAQPTAVQYAIAKSLISQLERTWRMNHGTFPEGDWSQLAGDEAAITQYRTTLLAWERWARDNPRSAAQLFDSVREGWGKRSANSP
jgi:RNA polymerase sigma factor (sigma-70 family)